MTDIARFQKDHILRSNDNMPLARVVISEDFRFAKGKSIPVLLMMVAESLTANPRGLKYYADGSPYKIADNTPSLRFSRSLGRHNINHFTLEPVDGE